MRKHVSNTIARTTLAFLRESGVDTRAIQARCQLSQYELDKPDGRITGRQHQRFIQAVSSFDFLWRERMLHTEAPDRIIDGAYALFPELVGFCLNQPTAGEAVNSYIHNRIIIGNCDDYRLQGDGEHLFITYLDELNAPGQSQSAIGNFMMLRELVRLYAPRAQLTLSLCGEAGPEHKALDDLFGCHCQFGQPANVLGLRHADLALSAETHLPLLHRQQRQQIAQRVLALQQEQGFAAMVASLLGEALCNEKMGDASSCLDHLCAVMNMSRWTLNTRLQQEEQTFSKVLQRVRIEQACALLADSRMSVQEISDRLRFSSLSVFSRFFSTHLGASPRHYRQRSAGRGSEAKV